MRVARQKKNVNFGIVVIYFLTHVVSFKLNLSLVLSLVGDAPTSLTRLKNTLSRGLQNRPLWRR